MIDDKYPTQLMIDAGVNALMDMEYEHNTYEQVVETIFNAMIERDDEQPHLAQVSTHYHHIALQKAAKQSVSYVYTPRPQPLTVIDLSPGPLRGGEGGRN